MIEARYAVNISLVVFDINVDLTCSSWRAGVLLLLVLHSELFQEI